CEIFQVVDRSALLATAQLSPGDGSGKAVIALHPAGEDEQMFASRVGDAVLRGWQPKRKLGTEDSLHLRAADIGSLGEACSAVEAVMIGDRKRSESEPFCFGDEVFGRRCAVEERERRVRMQFCVGNRVLGTNDLLGRL